ncbi:hypothetical protein FRAHR75_110004 [Frankia sp. Hr75.2]|nr:hypothetical protein FRAHR75_110004 [Frankia sp. Hr75.2]
MPPSTGAGQDRRGAGRHRPDFGMAGGGVMRVATDAGGGVVRAVAWCGRPDRGGGPAGGGRAAARHGRRQ